MSGFVEFVWHDAVYRLSETFADAGKAEIIRQRDLLERYIACRPEFGTSLVPVAVGVDAPAIAREMAAAARVAGVGPMAAVAGAMAQYAVAAMVDAGAGEAIVDNGGDLVIHAARTILVGLFAGAHPASGMGDLALRITPGEAPCAVCSSSASMGHSTSFGRADLATVIATDAAVADAVATALCNAATSPEAAAGAVETVAALGGVGGALVMIDGRLIASGEGVDLVRHADPELRAKVSAHERSEFRR